MLPNCLRGGVVGSITAFKRVAPGWVTLACASLSIPHSAWLSTPDANARGQPTEAQSRWAAPKPGEKMGRCFEGLGGPKVHGIHRATKPCEWMELNVEGEQPASTLEQPARALSQ